jgi:EAL domain-containing protein (putative c-di-GMP-specific phosphodiesterase class I)
MLANHLGLRTVAEGVESEEQCLFLKGHDCREIQGYLISEALDANAFAERFLGNAMHLPRTGLASSQ